MQITIRNLSKRYGSSKYALRDIDLDIGCGMFGLLGPNGAGKTTLMRVLVTLLLPTTGDVTIDGLDLRKDRGAIRRLVGYLPQDFTTFSKLATWEFLDYVAALSGVRNRRERMNRIDNLLDEVGLYAVRDRKATKLSGGMKRRLGIAQTLIGDPRVMVVDEPTVGLDPEERLRFRNLMADLSQQDRIIILSTHIVGDISSTCSNLALLHTGKIVFKGAPSKLIDPARGKVWQVTTQSIELDKFKTRYPVISAVPAEGGYELRLVADKPPRPDSQPLEPNLEDAYIHFVQSLGYDMNMEATTNSW